VANPSGKPGRGAVLLVALASCLAALAGSAPQQRVHELGVIDYYARYYNFDKRGRPAADRGTPALCELLRQAEIRFEVIDVDVLLARRKAARDTFKRLLIPEFAFTLTQDHYDGALDYVEDGGLLILNNSYFALDRERFYWCDAADKQTRIPERTFLGVRGHRSPVLTRIKLLDPCPLTAGLSTGAWIDLRETAWARQTHNSAAEVVGIGNVVVRGVDVSSVVLAYRKVGEGASIYFGPFLRAGAFADPALRRLVDNAFSAETLAWLCLQAADEAPEAHDSKD